MGTARTHLLIISERCFIVFQRAVGCGSSEIGLDKVGVIVNGFLGICQGICMALQLEGCSGPAKKSRHGNFFPNYFHGSYHIK